MKAAVLQFPGSNCDRDIAVALNRVSGHNRPARMIWHKEDHLPDGLDIVAIPGGFSFGDYLRCGAIAAKSPIMRSVIEFANKGGYVLGICNGFQVLTESGFLPGILMRNRELKFICNNSALEVATSSSDYTSGWSKGDRIEIPIAHHDGNYFADEETLARLNGEDRVAFRYIDNPNGSLDDIAGILSENRRVLGMMPHPERAGEQATGNTDGQPLFEALASALVHA